MKRIKEGRVLPFIDFLKGMSSSSLANFVGNNYKDIDKFRDILYSKYLVQLQNEKGDYDDFHALLSRIAKKEMGINSIADEFGIYHVVESRKGVKTMKKLNEKAFDEDDKIAVLNQFLADEEGANEEELESTEHLWGNEFDSAYGEYLVVTEDEAEEEFHDSQMSLIDDMGLEGFSEGFQDTIISNFSNADDWFRDAMEESNQFYAEDIANEGSSQFESRLVEECYDAGIIDDDDFEEDEDGEVDYNNCKYSESELIDMYVDNLNDSGDDPADWYVMNFGEEEYKQAVIDHGDIDWDAVIDEVEKWDGKANTLARYDGEEHEVKYDGEWFYIYRTN